MIEINFGIKKDVRRRAMLALIRLGAHMSLHVLVERTLVTHGFLAYGAEIGVVLPEMNLLVALEAVIGGESGTALALELFETAVQFDVILQRQNGLHLFAAQVTDVVSFTGVNRVAVGQLLGSAGEPLLAVFAVVRQRVLIGRVPLLVVLQVVLVFETHATQFAGVLQQLLLVTVDLSFVGGYILSRVEFLMAQVTLELPLVGVRVHVVD